MGARLIVDHLVLFAKNIEDNMIRDDSLDNLDEDGFPIEEGRKSKSQVKREMLKLQEYGARLVELSPEQLRKIEMPEKLREEVLLAKSLKKHAAKSRQIHHIGAMMRNVDPEPIINALDRVEEFRLGEARDFKQVELWRDGLIDDKKGIFEELIEKLPGADRQHINQLVRNARQEKAKEKPPKSARVLFRYIMELSHEEEV